MRAKGFVVLCVCLAVLCAEATAEVGYSITNLGTFGEENSYARSINNAGQVFWKARIPAGPSIHLLWDPSSGVEILGSSLPDGASVAQINDLGQMLTGWIIPGQNYTSSFLWDGAGEPEYIGPFSPRGLNNSGAVFGELPTSHPHTVSWDSVYGMQDIGSLGGPWTEGRGINNLDQIVGASTTNIELIGHPTAHSTRYSPGQIHAYLWDPSHRELHLPPMVDLGTLGGDQSWAMDVNDSSQAVGWSYTGNGHEFHAFFWDEDNGMQDLGTLPGSDYSEAEAINNLGQVVGSGSVGAFIWDSTNGIQALADFLPENTGWDYFHPTDINDAGQIVGYSATLIWNESFGYYDEQYEAVLLTHIPEPVTLTLLLMGCFVVGKLQPKRRQR